jgi:hypothetical protein
MFIGTTCVKKYGISNHLKNRILIQVLKENLMSLEAYSLEEKVKTWIQTNYSNFRNKINACSQGEFDYYDIVAPFRRLLNDVCELVTEYNFDLISLLKEIERDVESMNASTKHHMIDEYDDLCSISTVDSEVCMDHVKEEIVYTISECTSETVDEEVSSVVSFVKSEFSVEEDDIASVVNSEFSVEEENEDALSVVSFTYSEFSVEESDIEQGPKALPIAIADPYCTDPNCSPDMHRYCELKRRIDRVHKGCIEHRLFIQSIRTELEVVLETARNFRYQIHRDIEFAENYMVERRNIHERNLIIFSKKKS